MSPTPEYIEQYSRPAPLGGSDHLADVIDISPWHESDTVTATVQRANQIRPQIGHDDTVVLGLLAGRRGGFHSAPPPARLQHRAWMLSSLVIAGGGVAAVMAAGEIGGGSLIATVAVIATVVCGAILVAAQITDEVRRARR